MKKKIVYAFGIANIILIILNWFVFTNRLYSVEYYHLIDTLSQFTQFLLSYEIILNFITPFFIVISTIFIFFLEVKKGVIPGMLGFVLYAMNDINVMLVSTRAFILRVFVLIFYFSTQVAYIYLILKPKKKEIDNIKKIVIDMSDKFTLTTIKEISEKSESDHNRVSKTVNKLINDGTINADLFRRSKTVAFYKEYRNN